MTNAIARSLWRGRPEDPAWARPAAIGLLVGTGLLYLWGLGASGWANSFYSAAAQAGSVSWKAFFFGASDASSSITVDKTPASLWVMALSVRLFGLNPWSILVPQALAGVAAVGLLYAGVRRWFGAAAGLLAGAVMATTPVATLMFRFNNPDALLTLLLVAAAYATIRAVEAASTRWLALAGVAVGLGFMTKMLQALLVVPALAIAYLWAAPSAWWRRLGQLAMAGAAMLLAGGWWVAVVELMPASARPYIGGSQTNSVIELTLGYNGFGRLTGAETGSVGGGPGRGWGQTGWTRLFDLDNGGQISWLMPAALVLLAAGLALRWRAPRTDRGRAAYLIWGGWLLVTGAVFSLMAGIFHAYYSVALVPAVGALVGMGAVDLWRHRDRSWARLILGAALAVTAIWSFVLLGRSPEWYPALRPTVLWIGLAAAVLLVAWDARVSRWLNPTLARTGAPAVALVGIAAALAGPAGYSLSTAASPHLGAIPSAGPSVAGAGLGPPGPVGPRLFGAGPGGAGPQTGGAPPGGGLGGLAALARGMGGLLEATTPDPKLVALLRQDAASYSWVAAAVGSNNAAGYQLATGLPVMPVGGFNGSDPSPTLAQFQQYVAQGRIHYFLGGGAMRGNGGSAAAQQIATWVAQTFTATTVAGVTVYDLSSP
jgi:4-amino-4-deoxy-L-arabinose transferase-like glycosyltransferase